MKQRVIGCAVGPVLVTAITTQYPEAFRAQTPVLEAILSIVDGRYLASQASVRPSYETEVRTPPHGPPAFAGDNHHVPANINCSPPHVRAHSLYC